MMNKQNQNQQRDVSVAFQAQKKKLIQAGFPLIALLFALLLLQQFYGSSVAGFPVKYLVFVYLGLVVVFLTKARKWWRCPACHQILGRNQDPAFCVHCGARLK